MKRFEYDEEISKLKAEGLKAGDIARRLNISRCTVYDIFKRLDRGGYFLEKLKKVTILREQGKTYQEIADELGCDREYIERFCQRNGLKYTQEELKQRQTEVGREKAVHLIEYRRKPLSDEEWSQKVFEKFGESFELVSVGEPYNEHLDRKLIVRCLKCGAEKEVSSISFRGKNGKHGYCDKCSRPKATPRLSEEVLAFRAMNREIEKQKAKAKREKKKTIRKLKEDQLLFRVCECGSLLLPGKSKCDECKRKSLRKAEQRKATRRRLRTREDFDTEVTLEWTVKTYNNICYLCGETCNDKDYQFVNGVFIVGPTYPSMEHVIPICKGGKHTKQNVKLAHWKCNVEKGTRILAS